MCERECDRREDEDDRDILEEHGERAREDAHPEDRRTDGLRPARELGGEHRGHPRGEKEVRDNEHPPEDCHDVPVHRAERLERREHAGEEEEERREEHDERAAVESVHEERVRHEERGDGEGQRNAKGKMQN